MKVRDLRQMVERLPATKDDQEVEVWLPGSTIRLGTSFFEKGGKLMVEGNLNPGSALERQ